MATKHSRPAGDVAPGRVMTGHRAGAPPADWVLEHGGFVVNDDLGVVLLADVFVVEHVANGASPLPETWQLVRADCRRLYAFRWPSERAL